MMCVWAVPSTCPPSPRAAAASPLNAREPEPEPRPALRLPQHPGPPQSPHVTSGCPITAAPAHIKGAGCLRDTPPGRPAGNPRASEGGVARRERGEERGDGAHPSGGAWVGGTLAEAAAGLCVSPRPHTQKCQGCAFRAPSPEICRNALLPPAPIPFFAPKPSGRHRWTRTRESSASPHVRLARPSARSRGTSPLGTLPRLRVTGDRRGRGPSTPHPVNTDLRTQLFALCKWCFK